MSFNFDSEQLDAAHVECNAVISAGAGSGKTSVLAERFCWLIEDKKAKIDEIITLTFTQKAAAEMYERIYYKLNERRNISGDSFICLQIENFDQAQISTLDSFCSQIVRNSSALFGLAPDFEYNEEQILRQTQKISLDFIMKNLENPGLVELIQKLGFENTWQNLLTDLAVTHFHPAQKTDFIEMYEKQIRKCKEEIGKSVKTWENLTADLLAIKPSTAFIQKKQEYVRSLAKLSGCISRENYKETLELLQELKLNKPGGKANEDTLLLKELIDLLKKEANTLQVLSGTLIRQDILEKSFLLLSMWQERFITWKIESGLLTFQDIAELSVQALIRNKPLREFYKSKFRYILIDEFQDNNRLQKDLLYLLAEKKDVFTEGVPCVQDLEQDKLFFVGDEKQSIYRFRGADVSVFKSLSNDLAAAGGRALPLNTNYRSEAGLISFINRIFTRVMEGAVSEYEACYQELKPGVTGNDLKPEVFFLYKPFSDEDADYSDTQSEAYYLACFLKDTVENERLYVQENGTSRPADYKDFALLMRSTSNQTIYESMFKVKDIPFTTSNVRSLFLEAPVYDFYMILQLAVYPEDRSAYAGLLRSPFVNISDRALLHLFLQNLSPFEGIDDEEITKQDRDKLKKGGELYRFVAERIDRIPLSELIHHLWYKTGYRYYILKKPQYHNYLEYYDYLIKLAEKADSGGVVVFLDFIRNNLGKYEKIDDMEVLRAHTEGVQISTIHKSKGLEFPIVILAETGNRGRNLSETTPYYVSDEYGITLNLGHQNYFTLCSMRENDDKELAEIKRLLYVSLTRAKHHLIISGSHNRQNRSTPKAHLNMIFKGLRKDPESLSVQEEFRDYYFTVKKIGNLTVEEFQKQKTSLPPITPEDMAPFYEKAHVIKREYSRREYSVTELADILHSDLKPDEMEEKKLPSLDADPILKKENLENNFGSLVHYLLSQKLTADTYSLKTDDWLRFDIPEEYRGLILASAEKLCDTFLCSAIGKAAIKAHNLNSEFPFVYRWSPGPLYISGQMDLIFETDSDVKIVDFKTDRTYKPGEYKNQLGLYSLAAGELFPDKPVHPTLFFLRSGEAMSLATDAEWRKSLTEGLNRVTLRSI